jgi:hypothetical protein
MKKYLFTAALAVAVSGAFVSCHEDEISGSLIEQKAKAFEEIFVEAFGQPVPYHTWGFKTNNITDGSGVTRTVHKKDPAQGFDYEHEPPAVTEAEAAYVYEWFQKEENKGLSEIGRDWDTFYLQHVYGTMDKQKKGLWNLNGGGDQEFTDKGGMDYLILTDNNGYEEHINDFNAEMGGPYGIVYMTESSALYFGYHGSWDNSDRQLFKLAQITVPGRCFGEGEADRTGWYVGLSLYGYKYDNGPKRIGEQRKDWGDDWILKVVPGESTPPTPSGDNWKIVEGEKVIEAGRVFCEDLGANTRNDVDYNDVVFDAIIVNHYIKLVTTTVDENGVETTSETTTFTKDGITGVSETYAKVCLLAAGGTIPANVCGHEIHNELGNGNLSTVVMINTTTDRESVNGAQIDNSCPPVIIQETVSGVTQDKKFYYDSTGEHPITCINDIDIVVLYGNAVTTLTANPGSEEPAVPYKICVPIGTPWAKERVNIGIAYTSFAEYCGINPDKQFWNDIGKDGPVWENCGSLFTIKENGVERFLDEGDLLGDGEVILAQSTGGSSVNSTTLWSDGPVSDYKEVEIAKGSTLLNNIKNGDVIRIYATPNDAFKLEIHTLEGWYLIGSEFNKNNVSWQNSSYFDYTLSGDEGSSIKTNGIKFQFWNIKDLTKIEVVHK